jgi:hypothetical protein
VPSLPAGKFGDLPVDETYFATAVVVARLRGGRPTGLRVRGRSMYPFLVPGQTVLLEPCEAGSLRRGDLGAFERDGRVVLHRVLAVHGESGTVTEKGDNVRRGEVVDAGHIIGRATAVLSPRHASLNSTLYTLTGRWLANLSALHAGCHRFASRHPRACVLLAKASTAVLRLSAALVRPPR